MRDVMWDLETLRQRPGCVILSVGAVGFDPETGELGPEFYEVISKQSCIDATLHIDSDTLAWWMKQSPEARKVLAEAELPIARPLGGVLSELTAWFHKNFGPDVFVWGNGSDFDNAILAHAYRAVRQRQPWKFWNSGCHRTLKRLRPGIEIVRQGTHHNALDDARDQAVQALKIFGNINRNPDKRLKELEEIMVVIASTADPNCDYCGGSGIFYGNVGPTCGCTKGNGMIPFPKPASAAEEEEDLIG